jgi:hypothetical protein
MYALRFARCLACALALRLRSGRSAWDAWWLEDITFNVKEGRRMGNRGWKKKEGRATLIGWLLGSSAHCWVLTCHVRSVSGHLTCQFLDLAKILATLQEIGRSEILGFKMFELWHDHPCKQWAVRALENPYKNTESSQSLLPNCLHSSPIFMNLSFQERSSDIPTKIVTGKLREVGVYLPSWCAWTILCCWSGINEVQKWSRKAGTSQSGWPGYSESANPDGQQLKVIEWHYKVWIWGHTRIVSSPRVLVRIQTSDTMGSKYKSLFVWLLLKAIVAARQPPTNSIDQCQLLYKDVSRVTLLVEHHIFHNGW